MKLGKRTITVGVVSAATVAASITGMALVGSADASTSVHTFKFTAVDKGDGANLGKDAFAEKDNDVKAGKVIGYDVLSGTYNPATKKVVLHIAFTRKGGLIYLRDNQTGGILKTKGTVVGGSGKFKGATGTFTTSQKSENSVRTHVVVKVRY